MSFKLSIVMRSKNDAALIGKTLQAVYTQDYTGGIELVHIDSGSTDGTVDIIRSTHPHKLIQIPAHEYVPGKVLNQGMRETCSEWVVFLNSDAEPANPQWLNSLVNCALSHSEVGTAFSRQIPRNNCWAVYAHDYQRCFGPNRESAHWPHFFSMVSCIVHRKAWEEHPFREDLQYAEDHEWSLRIKKAGWKILFAEKSVAIHSHNYSLREAYRRSYGDRFAIAATTKTKPSRFFDPFWFLRSVIHEAGRDLRYCWQQKILSQWPHCAAVRCAQSLGKQRGYRDGWYHYHSST